MVSQRRTAEDEDDLSLFFGSLPTSPHTQPEETDELGRVIPQADPAAGRRDRFAARVARRQNRHAVIPTSHVDADDGYLTDSSLPPSDTADYTLATQKLHAKTRNILSDVKAKDFLDPKLGLKKWFTEWREKYNESYVGAWGGLGMVGTWEFWVRFEMLGSEQGAWDPVREERSLDTFAWYLALHDYSRVQRQGDDEDETMEEEELGPEGDLVSAMITTAVIPRVCKILEGGGFDPYSGKHARRLVDLAEEIEVSVGKENAKFEVCFRTRVLGHSWLTCFSFRSYFSSQSTLFSKLPSPPFSLPSHHILF